MAKTLCVACRGVFDTGENTLEQDKMGDEFFCPSCFANLKIGTAA